MRYQLEYHPNPNHLSIHADKEFTKEKMEFFESKNCEENTMPSFVKDLFLVAGISYVSLKRYEIHMEKGNVFSWNKIIKEVISILKMHFSPEGEVKEIASPMRYYIDERGYRRDTPQPVEEDICSQNSQDETIVD